MQFQYLHKYEHQTMYLNKRGLKVIFKIYSISSDIKLRLIIVKLQAKVFTLGVDFALPLSQEEQEQQEEEPLTKILQNGECQKA